MKKLYPRICAMCGKRFLGGAMDYRCAECRDAELKYNEQRAVRDSELGQIMRSGK